MCSASSTVTPSTWSIRSPGGIVLEAVRRTAQRRRRRRRGRSAGRPRRGPATRDRLGQFGDMRLGRRRAVVALAHHHPAHVVDHGLAALVEAPRAHIDDAALPVRVLLEADHLGDRRQRVARIDGLEEAAVGVAEIGDGVERDVRHRLAEHDVEGEQVVDRARRIADRPGEGLGALRREARPVERRIERGVADVERARRRVADRLADAEILEEAAGGGLGRGGSWASGVRKRGARCRPG